MTATRGGTATTDGDVREGLDVAIKFVFFPLANQPSDPADSLDTNGCAFLTAPAKFAPAPAEFIKLPIRGVKLQDATNMSTGDWARSSWTRPTSSCQTQQGQYSPAGW